MNLIIRRCDNARIPTGSHKPEDMRCEDARIQASAHEPEDMRMQGCKQVHMNRKIQGRKDVRIQESAHKHKGMRIQGCVDTRKCTKA